MSIKIWKAYRIPKSRLNEFTALAREATWEHLLGKIDSWMPSVKQAHVDTRIDERLRVDGELPAWIDSDEMLERVRLQMQWDILRRQIVRDSTSPERCLYDCDASFNFWLDKRYAYIIPYGRMKLPDELPDWVEDYHYQNQTDRAEGVSSGQWRGRRRKWNKLCLDDWDAKRYHHTIASFSASYSSSVIVVERHLGLIP